MIPGDLAARLRLLTEASLFDSEPPLQGPARVREIQARLPELAPGERFTATLQRALPDGTFQAVVAGKTYTLALNRAAKSGDTVELVVTKSTRNAVFAEFTDTSATGSPVPAGETVRPTLSPVGKLIGFLLTGQPPAKPTELAAGSPLLPSPPSPGGTQLAPALQQAVSESGLFYESHQLQWLAGKLDTAALKQEPQGKIPVERLPLPAAPLTPDASPASKSALTTPAPTDAMLGNGFDAPDVPDGLARSISPALTGRTGTSPMPSGQLALPGGLSANILAALRAEQAQREPGPLPGAPSQAEDSAFNGNVPGTADASSSQSQPSQLRVAMEYGKAGAAATFAPHSPETEIEARGGSDSSATSAPAQARPAAIPERLVPMVHQQLDAMATQNYVWHGQVWPGQTMEWEIEDPAQDREASGDEPALEWKTTLRLKLPTLGDLEARLILTPAGVAVRLLADDPGTVGAFNDARAALESALAAANVPLTGFVAEGRHAE